MTKDFRYACRILYARQAKLMEELESKIVSEEKQANYARCISEIESAISLLETFSEE